VPTRIELLKQAGFSDAEIGDWATTERPRMQEAGFSDNEIDEEFGVTRPPEEVPAPFIERLKLGNRLQRILGAAGEYAQHYFGDEPLGFSPENKKALSKLGVFGDIIVPAAKPVDALLRSVPAGIAGLGAGIGQAVEEGHDAALGPGPYAKGKAARDFAQLAQIAALVSGADAPKAMATRAPTADVANRPVIALPQAEDFRNAATAISGTQASFRIEQKLLRLWTDHGIPPAEVAEDALRDRTIGEAIRSDSEKLPDVYAGTNTTATAASARPNVPAQAAESAEADSATVPAESKSAPVEADDRSSGNPNTSGPARMIAEAKARMQPPPPRPQRPFDKDYPEEPATDAQGQLLADIEGRILGAKFVAGRQFSGKADVPLSPEDIKGAIAEAGIGLYQVKDTHPDVAKTLSKALRGFYDGSDNGTGLPDSRIFLNMGPKARDRDLVIAHEFGHAIDHLAGYLSATLTDKEMAELSFVYADLRYSRTKGGHLLQPENFGYPPKLVNSELVAEGFRAYMTDPNYFKTAAPKAAARFRAAVNVNPYLRHAIQLNSLGAIGLIGAGIRSQDRDDQ
jgi:hypothetical protein